MRPGFVLSGPAARDLEEIVDHLIRAAGPDVAVRVANRLLEACRRLAVDPGIGHVRPDLTKAPVRFWSSRPYLIVYRPGSRPLEIVRVLHAARDARPHLGEEV
jgi:antitoxin ParD1/3/4/toxin ParE1/3/4